MGVTNATAATTMSKVENGRARIISASTAAFLCLVSVLACLLVSTHASTFTSTTCFASLSRTTAGTTTDHSLKRTPSRLEAINDPESSSGELSNQQGFVSRRQSVLSTAALVVGGVVGGAPLTSTAAPRRVLSRGEKKETESSSQPAEQQGLVSTNQVAQLLRAIPTFTIVDTKGVPYMVVGEDAKVTGYFFTTYEEAARILQAASDSTDRAVKEQRQEQKAKGTSDPSLLINPWKEARISTVPLDFAVTLVTGGGPRGRGNFYQVAPAESDIDDALEVTGKSDLAEGKVPLFYMENFTTPTTIDERRRTPLYFSKRQLVDEYRQQEGKEKELPPVKVTELFAVLYEMVRPDGKDTDLQNLVLVAPPTSAKQAQVCVQKYPGQPPFVLGQRNLVL